MTSPTASSIDANGISSPPFSDVLSYLKTGYRSIFGADTYLESDSQDGQFLGIVAAAINDTNAATTAAYNSFSPSTAQGNGLSRIVKINGLARNIATSSTVNVTIGGTVGTTIENGIVADAEGNQWGLPATVIIPASGVITVTATASKVGATTAAIGTITKIQTPVYGWQTVINPSAASPGAPVQSDAALRVQQGNSTASPSVTILGGMLGAIQDLNGVTDAKVFENDTGTTDANGIPSHSISAVVLGGAALDIAKVIADRKAPGAYTYGTTVQSVVNDIGTSDTIRFFVPSEVQILVGVTIQALDGYTSLFSAQIKQAIADYINALSIGQLVSIARLYLPAQLSGGAGSSTFELISLQISAYPNALGNVDVPVAFNEKATSLVSNIALTIV